MVDNLRNNLVGRPAIEAPDLVRTVAAISSNDEYTQKIMAVFLELFTGLGELKGEYHVKVKENTKPFTLTTPHRVPIPLRQEVKNELDRKLKLGVIRRVDEPTPWCAGMVVVPKPNGDVHIWVDVTKLNKSVCRERHLIPAVDEILAQLSGAKVFTKLDANSGFWQIKLAEESALLTTFITPFGRYCFNRVSFGITSAPGYFQKRMSQILAGLPGVVCMIDDTLVYGGTQDEHDRNLKTVLHRIKEGGTLNFEKCTFSCHTMKFLGHYNWSCMRV